MTNPFQGIGNYGEYEPEPYVVAKNIPADEAAAISALSNTGPSSNSYSNEQRKASATPPPPLKRPSLCGTTYSETDAIALLNSHFFIGKNGQEIGVFRVNDDGSVSFVSPEQFKLEVQNIFVEIAVTGLHPVPKTPS
jgi:hypothetical protein